tara:strand:+ start:72 stop:497 length:426 start_codon:yes stop_codon:yes gene_type:complete
MKDIKIKPIVEQDYEFINQWWDNIEKLPPPRQLLPENGLHGLIAYKQDKPIVCLYIYLTNSKFAYSDYMISDINYKGKDRFNIILLLMQESIKKAFDLGFEDFWFMTKDKGMLRRCKTLGINVSEDPYYLICTAKDNKNIK